MRLDQPRRNIRPPHPLEPSFANQPEASRTSVVPPGHPGAGGGASGSWPGAAVQGAPSVVAHTPVWDLAVFDDEDSLAPEFVSLGYPCNVGEASTVNGTELVTRGLVELP
jgi:hypothetical protein